MTINIQILVILKEYYGIEATNIEQQIGGWSALAFLIRTESEKYFLKVYSKDRPSIAQWIYAIDRYVPLVKWLHNNTILKDNIINPIYTKFNSYKCEDDKYVYVLFEYVEGDTIGENSLNYYQINELAKIIGLLHGSTSTIPYELKEQFINENFDIEFCDRLTSFIADDLFAKEDALLFTVKPYIECLSDLINRISQLSDSLKHKPTQFVVCHSDAHNWNIIQSNSLVLIDWECLKLALPEQDLVLFAAEPYAMQFLFEYKKYVTYNVPNIDAFEFYYIKRKLEDIWEWIKQLRIEGLVLPEDKTLEFMKSNLQDCAKIDYFRSDLVKIFNG